MFDFLPWSRPMNTESSARAHFLSADQLVNISTLTNISWLLSRIVNEQTSWDLLIVQL